MYQYKNILTPANYLSGLTDELLLAPVSFFETIVQPQPDMIHFEKESEINQNHVFKPEYQGFIRVRLAPRTSRLTAQTIDGLSAQKLEQKYEVMIQGSYSELHGFMKFLHNEQFICLVRDASSCHPEMFYQLGTKRRPAACTLDWDSGDELQGNKAYSLHVSSISESIMIYNGNIKAYGKDCNAFGCEFTCEFY